MRIIETMARDLNFRTKIVPCPVVREKRGIALSSRNAYLSEEEKENALKISQILKKAKEDIKKKSYTQVLKKVNSDLKKISGSKVDYAEIRDYKNLSAVDKNTKKAVLAVAVWIGKTRLIDNIILSK